MSVLYLTHRKRLEQQQKMLEEDRKRRQFEEQKQKLRLLSSVKPKVSVSAYCLSIAFFLACPVLVFVTHCAFRYSVVLLSDGGEEP